jgi:hypothetical protein
MTENINIEPQNTPQEQIKPDDELGGIIIIKRKEYTYEEIKRLAGVMGTQKRLAAVLDCAEQYISYLKARDAKFALACDLGKDFANGEVISSLYENCTKHKDTSAQKYWLSNNLRDEYADRSKLEVEAKVSVIEQIVDDIDDTFDIPDDSVSHTAE